MSRSHGYENRHGHMAAVAVVLLLPAGVGVQVGTTAQVMWLMCDAGGGRRQRYGVEQHHGGGVSGDWTLSLCCRLAWSTLSVAHHRHL